MFWFVPVLLGQGSISQSGSEWELFALISRCVVARTVSIGLANSKNRAGASALGASSFSEVIY